MANSPGTVECVGRIALKFREIGYFTSSTTLICSK